MSSEKGGLGAPSYTVKEPVKLVGEPYFAGQPDTVLVHPRPSGDGIWFKRGDMLTPLKASTLHPHTELTARFLQMEGISLNSPIWCVVEHTVAALFGALGADASAVIEVVSAEKAGSGNFVSGLKRGVSKVLLGAVSGGREKTYLPVLGPGIKQPFDALYAARTPVSSRVTFSADEVGLRRHTERYKGVGDAYLIECDRTSVTYTEEDPQIGGKRSMKFSIDDTPQMTVHSSAQPDVSLVARLDPQPYSAGYTPEFLIDHPELLQARPLGRLENPTLYRLFLVLQPVFDFQGISEHTYVMATPHDKTPQDLIDKMHPAFQAGQNEWFAHTVLDMIAETGIIPRTCGARRLGLSVDVRNSNHAFRMRAISTLIERNYFGPRLPLSDPTV